MSQREWVQFVKDCKIPIPITEINDVFRRVDRAEKEAKAKDPKAKADKQMVLAEFLEALVRTHIRHAERRGHEMEDAAAQLTALGFDALVTASTPARYRATADRKVRVTVDGSVESDIESALGWLAETVRLKGKAGA